MHLNEIELKRYRDNSEICSPVNNSKNGGNINIFIKKKLKFSAKIKLEYFTDLYNTIGMQQINVIIQYPESTFKPISNIIYSHGKTL